MSLLDIWPTFLARLSALNRLGSETAKASAGGNVQVSRVFTFTPDLSTARYWRNGYYSISRDANSRDAILTSLLSSILVKFANIAPSRRRPIDIRETERSRPGLAETKVDGKGEARYLRAHGLTGRGRKIVVELTINEQTVSGSRAELSGRRVTIERSRLWLKDTKVYFLPRSMVTCSP